MELPKKPKPTISYVRPQISEDKAREMARAHEERSMFETSLRELEMVRPGKTCGTCAHFALREGQQRIDKHKFLDVLTKEHEWQLRYLASPVNELGICGQFESGSKGGSSTITGIMHKACDAYKEKK